MWELEEQSAGLVIEPVYEPEARPFPEAPTNWVPSAALRCERRDAPTATIVADSDAGTPGRRTVAASVNASQEGGDDDGS